MASPAAERQAPGPEDDRDTPAPARGSHRQTSSSPSCGATEQEQPDVPTTIAMTPLEAIAYLHNTLPAKPELYDDSEHTAALIALGPLVSPAEQQERS